MINLERLVQHLALCNAPRTEHIVHARRNCCSEGDLEGLQVISGFLQGVLHLYKARVASVVHFQLVSQVSLHKWLS